MFGTAVAPGFAVKIPVFNIHAHGQTHVGIQWQWFARRVADRRTAETEQGRIAPREHLGLHFNLHHPAVARAGDHRQTAGGPAANVASAWKSNGEMKPSAFTHTRMRLAKMWRSTGRLGCRFAPSTQSYFDCTRARSTRSRAMPPMPLVNRTTSSDCGSRRSAGGRCRTGVARNWRFAATCGSVSGSVRATDSRRDFVWRKTATRHCPRKWIRRFAEADRWPGAAKRGTTVSSSNSQWPRRNRCSPAGDR